MSIPEYRVAMLGAWSTDRLARKLKQMLTERAVPPENIVSITHARSGLVGAAVGTGPFSVLVVWTEP